jgi:hypothetical protein
MADPIRCVYSLDGGYFCTKHSNAFYDASCRLLEGKPCEDQKPPKPTTNYDRLIRKTPEEMAEKIGGSIDCEVCKTMHHSESGECPCRPHQSCVDFWLDWLRQEAKP